MPDSDFGDWEPQDSYSPDNEPDPLQVAKRIYELGEWLHAMHERRDYVVTYDDIRSADIDAATRLIDYLRTQGHDGAALALHNSNGHGRDWKELSPEEQEVALAITSALVVWLRQEGTVIR